MMSVKLALGNVKKSIGSFLVYFVTLALGVAMFYAFTALQDQSLFRYFEKVYNQKLTVLFESLSIFNKFIAFVFGLIILYATSYLLRKRKKEFGLYMILGMNKRKLSFILVLETFFIGVFSLIFGLLLGVGFSQLINLFLGHLFVADISRLSIQISLHAIGQTLISFGIIYVVAMCFSVVIVNRAKLIDLLKASQQNETSWWQKPWLGSLLLVVGLAILSWSYYIAWHLTEIVHQDLSFDLILYAIVGGIVGTYLVFMGFSAFIPVIAPKFKGFYYRKLHSFGIRQFSTQLAKSVFSLATICLLQFFALGILVASFNIKVGIEEKSLSVVPFDFQYAITQAADENDEGIPPLDQTIVQQAVEKYRAYFKGMVKKELQYDTYIDPKLDQKLGTNQLLGIQDDKHFLQHPLFVSNSQYNQIAPYYHLPKLTIKPGEYALVLQSDGYFVKEVENKLHALPDITVANQSLVPAKKQFINGTLQSYSYFCYFILNDRTLHQLSLQLYGKFIGTIYNQKGLSDEKALANNWQKALPNDLGSYSAQSRYATKTSAASDALMITVVGMYLGIFFLIAAIGILSLKSLIDFEKHQQNYRILRQLGTTETMIQRSLFNQIAIFFIIPLVGALIHMIFGLKFTKDYLMLGGGYELDIQRVGVVIGFVLLVNLGYLLITYLMNRSVVKEG